MMIELGKAKRLAAVYHVALNKWNKLCIKYFKNGYDTFKNSNLICHGCGVTEYILGLD